MNAEHLKLIIELVEEIKLRTFTLRRIETLQAIGVWGQISIILQKEKKQEAKWKEAAIRRFEALFESRTAKGTRLKSCQANLLAIESGFRSRAGIIRKTDDHKPVLKKKKK